MAQWQLLEQENNNLVEHLCRTRLINPDQIIPRYPEDFHSPMLLPDINRAIELISEALTKHWRVLVFGDYDADGTPAAALLYQAFSRIGLVCEVVLPNRQTGYGLNKQIIEETAKTFQLLVTVDNGITAVDEIALAKKLGLKTLIIDHHLPGHKLPPSDAIIDPHLKTSHYPFKDICGCALAYKLIEALSSRYPSLDESFLKWSLDLVAISTVADMMPLVDENRAFVFYGLKVLRKNRRLGLQAMLTVAQANIENINARALGFIIGPRLNASGRLGDNRPALDLLLAETLDQANNLAEKIEQTNRRRLKIVEQATAEALGLVLLQNQLDDRLFTVIGQDWPSGVIGLIAGRLSQEHARPVIVGVERDGQIHASARSIPSYHITEALTANSTLLKRFGGHAGAAGMSLEEKNWSGFSEAMKKNAADSLKLEDLEKIYLIDAKIDQTYFDLALIKKIQMLEPFGIGNPAPLFLLTDCHVNQARPVGSTGGHLKISLEKNNKMIDGIGFNLAKKFFSEPLEQIDVIGHLSSNVWNGNTSAQLEVVDYQQINARIKVVKNNGQTKN